MSWRKRFGKRPATTPLDGVSLKGGGFLPESRFADLRVWRTDEGDAVGISFVEGPPALPAGEPTLAQFERAFRQRAEQGATKIIELSVCRLANVKAVRCVSKIAKQPHGSIYISTYLLPFLPGCFVVKLQCEEHGMTGLREAVLFDRLMAQGKVQPVGNGQIQGEWEPDHPCYDAEFPDHPLTRLRRWTPRIASALTVADDIATWPPFELPES